MDAERFAVRIGAVVATAGSVVLLATYVLGSRVGMEDAPEPSDGLRVAFQVSVLLIAVGLVIVGLGEIRRVQRPSVSQWCQARALGGIR